MAANIAYDYISGHAPLHTPAEIRSLTEENWLQQNHSGTESHDLQAQLTHEVVGPSIGTLTIKRQSG